MREKGSYRREDLDAVLAGGFLRHLGVTVDGVPIVVPTAYGVEGNRLCVRGSVASRSQVQASESMECTTRCACVTVAGPRRAAQRNRHRTWSRWAGTSTRVALRLTTG
ncbi:pyridoxamine 5'-phosphate oxidase family protein [Streptomyces sp. NPDC056194]|uniref:pyridoxamine 5'-phosphate oxidase family protein n=1 Tax=unclassified Streptomyces TaxID=2593676 RepID=UPI0035D722D5